MTYRVSPIFADPFSDRPPMGEPLPGPRRRSRPGRRRRVSGDRRRREHWAHGDHRKAARPGHSWRGVAGALATKGAVHPSPLPKDRSAGRLAAHPSACAEGFPRCPGAGHGVDLSRLVGSSVVIFSHAWPASPRRVRRMREPSSTAGLLRTRSASAPATRIVGAGFAIAARRCSSRRTGDRPAWAPRRGSCVSSGEPPHRARMATTLARASVALSPGNSDAAHRVNTPSYANGWIKRPTPGFAGWRTRRQRTRTE